MRIKQMYAAIYFFLAFLFLLQATGSAQVEEEKQERKAQMQMLRKKPAGYNLYSSVAFFGGYDNNARLTPDRKGSGFQETLYSLVFNKPFNHGWGLNLYYDLDYLNYNNATDSSNLLNHLRADLHKKLNRSFTLGGGYDFSDFYYPDNEDGDFVFHKGFVYLKHFISRRTFQRLLFEYGYKYHFNKRALADDPAQLQNKNLVDNRQTIEYLIGSDLTSRFYAQLRARYALNDSNARFLDFYDYRYWELTPMVSYRLTRGLTLVSSFTFMRKEYDKRIVSTGTKKERDNVYAVNAGAKYKINKNQTASLFYTYRDNSTNEPLEKYNESVFTCGWEYSF